MEFLMELEKSAVSYSARAVFEEITLLFMLPNATIEPHNRYVMVWIKFDVKTAKFSYTISDYCNRSLGDGEFINAPYGAIVTFLQLWAKYYWND
jgi:hypothetical protein